MLDKFHFFLLAAHCGAKKVCFLLFMHVWRPNILLSCKKAVSCCIICKKSKSSTKSQPGLLLPLPIAKGKFMSWSIDFITNLPLYNESNAIFTCVDRLINYFRLIPYFVWEVALSASSVAKLFFENVVWFFGIPEELISGNDPRFTASFWWELWVLLGTNLLLGSAYQPQTGRQTKRAYRTLEQTLCCVPSEGVIDGSQWCILLP